MRLNADLPYGPGRWAWGGELSVVYNSAANQVRVITAVFDRPDILMKIHLDEASDALYLVRNVKTRVSVEDLRRIQVEVA